MNLESVLLSISFNIYINNHLIATKPNKYFIFVGNYVLILKKCE